MKLRRVVGESMLPGLVPGDLLLVSKRRKPHVGDIVVARINGREIVKRVVDVNETQEYTLEGDNKKASTDSRSFGSVRSKDIIGVAVWAIAISRFNRHSINKER